MLLLRIVHAGNEAIEGDYMTRVLFKKITLLFYFLMFFAYSSLFFGINKKIEFLPWLVVGLFTLLLPAFDAIARSVSYFFVSKDFFWKIALFFVFASFFSVCVLDSFSEGDLFRFFVYFLGINASFSYYISRLMYFFALKLFRKRRGLCGFPRYFSFLSLSYACFFLLILFFFPGEGFKLGNFYIIDIFTCSFLFFLFYIFYAKLSVRFSEVASFFSTDLVMFIILLFRM